MPLTFTLTTTKPDGVLWFPDFSEENQQIVTRINTWTSLQPGFIRQTTVDIDVNTRVMTFEFDSVENYANWFSLRNRLPDQSIRFAYIKANGMTVTINETLS
jgi:hypothetical protein